MRDIFFMPRIVTGPFYPGGFPFSYRNDNWQGNTKDMLIDALNKYWSSYSEKPEPLTDHDREILIQYCAYYINAPIWTATAGHAFGKELAELRKMADEMNNVEQLDEFIRKAMEIGLDPL